MAIRQDHQEIPEHHTEDAVRDRLERPKQHTYVADAILGGIDGCITTFAIVASSVGAGLPHLIALALGLANLLADGFSMAVSNYQAAKSRQDHIDAVRKQEERHIDEIPEGEREEVRQIYQAKGFEGELLEQVVDVITRDRELWVDTMLVEEYGLELESSSAYTAAFTTFVSFLLVGFMPLVPFLLPLEDAVIFPISCAIATLAFFAIGAAKGYFQHQSSFKCGLHTLLTGGVAAALAYGVGEWSQQWLS